MLERGWRSDRRARRPLIVALAGVLALGTVAGPLTACGWQADPSTEAGTTTGVAPTESPTQVDRPVRLAATPREPVPEPEPLLALATEDAARLTGSDPKAVRVVLVEAREWPDRSLGCPRPGMGYAQAITPGFLIVVEAAGQRLQYHTDRARVVLCPA